MAVEEVMQQGLPARTMVAPAVTTPTHTTATVTTTSGAALAANTSRVYALLVNDSEMAVDNTDEKGLRIEIGWEKYIITPGGVRHGTPYWSLECIGVLRYLALKYSLTILPPQLSSMMTISTDARLKMIGWYKPGKPHANDAARHLLRYMAKAGTLPYEMHNKAFGTPGDAGETAGEPYPLEVARLRRAASKADAFFQPDFTEESHGSLFTDPHNEWLNGKRRETTGRPQSEDDSR